MVVYWGWRSIGDGGLLGMAVYWGRWSIGDGGLLGAVVYWDGGLLGAVVLGGWRAAAGKHTSK